jgi:hypothetical protein
VGYVSERRCHAVDARACRLQREGGIRHGFLVASKVFDRRIDMAGSMGSRGRDKACGGSVLGERGGVAAAQRSDAVA